MNTLSKGYVLGLATTALFSCSKLHESKSNRASLSQVNKAFSEDDSTVKNGGNAIECSKRYESLGGQIIGQLDLFEARNRGLKPSLGDASLDPVKKVEFILARLRKLDANRAELYQTYLNTFMAAAQIGKNLHLPRVGDEEVVEMPGPDCQISQLAMQRTPKLPGDKRYVIRQEIWDQLQNDDKASLILHEIVYREAKSYGQTDSHVVRFYVGDLLSETFTRMDRTEYADYMDQWIKLPTYFIFHEIGFELRSLEFYPSGTFKSGSIKQVGSSTVAFEKIKTHLLAFNNSGHITYDENGSLISARTDSSSITIYGKKGLGAVPEYYEGCPLIPSGNPLYPTLEVSEVHVSNNELRSFKSLHSVTVPECAISDQSTFFYGEGVVELFPSGRISTAQLASGHWFKTVARGNVMFKEHDIVYFNEQGLAL